MRTTLSTSLAALLLALLPLTASGASYGDLSVKRKLQYAGLVAYVSAESVDVQAGTETTARTEVAFEVLEVLAGTAPATQLTFNLPEGQLAGLRRFVRIGGTPSFVEGHNYLVFLRNGSWQFSPIVNWKRGVLHETVVDGTKYMTRMNGRCIVDVNAEHGLVPGPEVVQPPPESGPVIGGNPKMLIPTSTQPRTPLGDTECLSTSAIIDQLSQVVSTLGYSGMNTDLEFSSNRVDTMSLDVETTSYTEPSVEPIKDELPPEEDH